MFHIFEYLNKYRNTKLIFVLSDPCDKESNSERKYWISSEFGHLQGTDELPPNKSQPYRLGFITSVNIDDEHEYDTVTRR